jgi:hypothetical protein
MTEARDVPPGFHLRALAPAFRLAIRSPEAIRPAHPIDGLQ